MRESATIRKISLLSLFVSVVLSTTHRERNYITVSLRLRLASPVAAAAAEERGGLLGHMQGDMQTQGLLFYCRVLLQRSERNHKLLI